MNGRLNNRGAGDLRRHLAVYDATVMCDMYNVNGYELIENHRQTWHGGGVGVYLTHLPLDKMDSISQMIFSAVFFQMKRFVF